MVRGRGRASAALPDPSLRSLACAGTGDVTQLRAPVACRGARQDVLRCLRLRRSAVLRCEQESLPDRRAGWPERARPGPVIANLRIAKRVRIPGCTHTRMRTRVAIPCRALRPDAHSVTHVPVTHAPLPTSRYLLITSRPMFRGPLASHPRVIRRAACNVWVGGAHVLICA